MDSQPGFLPAVKCRVARDLSRVFVRAGRRLGLAASWPRACLHLYSRFIAKFSYHSRFFRVAKRIRIRAGGDKFLHSRRYWTALGSQEAGGKGTPKRLRNLADHYWVVESGHERSEPPGRATITQVTPYFFFRCSKSASVNCVQFSRSVTSRFHCQARSGNTATVDVSFSLSARALRSANARKP